MNPLAVKIIDKLPKLSTVPNVYSKVNAAVNNPNSQASTVGDIISKDQALTAQILRLVNSAFYGFPGTIDNVSRAVTIVGFKQTRELVLAASIMNNFQSTNDYFDMQEFWKHSLAVASIAKILAEITNQQKSMESLFTAGLMHDIGRLIMIEKKEELNINKAFEVAQEKSMLLYKAEKPVCGVSHDELGEALASKWNLPPILRESISFHHHPARSLRFKMETATIHLADVLAHAFCLGSSGEEAVPIIDPNALKLLKVDPRTLDLVADKIEVLFPDIIETFLG